MSGYIVERYETHTQKVFVEAESEAEAIKKVLEGEGTDVNNGLEYIETNEDVGLPLEQYPGLAEELSMLDLDFESFVPAIRSVKPQ